MRIAFCHTETKIAPWLEGLRALLPEASIEAWHARPNGSADSTALADYAIVWAAPQAFFDEQTRLKAIFSTGAGVDALMQLALPAQAPVVRIDDAGMAVQMAEFVCHAVIRHFRELDGYAADVALGRWSFRRPQKRSEFPVGVMGLGVLGARVAKALQQFDFPVKGWSRSAKAIPGVHCFAGDAQFDDFLAASRVLVCLLPLTAGTEGIMRRETLAKLQPGGYVINVARGAHLVDADLLALIDEGHLAGAALDVFRTEPLPPQHPFWSHSRISVTPHTSARTLREESMAQIAGKIRALEQGLPIADLAGVVDLKKGY